MRTKYRDDSKRADQVRWERLRQEGKTTSNPDRLVRHPIWLMLMAVGFLAMSVGGYFIIWVPNSSWTWGLVTIVGCLIVGCIGSIWAQDDLDRWAETSEDEDVSSEEE